MRKSILSLVFLISLYAYSQQSTEYLIVEAPIGVQSADRVLWIKWTGVSRSITIPAPDSGIIFFDKSPGGGELKNYRYRVTTPYTDSLKVLLNNIYFPPSGDNPVAKRGIAFRAMDQSDMGSGIYYCVVALPLQNDTFISNEFQIIIETPLPVDWIGPSGKITSLTPTFQWRANSGVPYYHVILSDDVIKVDSSKGEVNLSGLSIIWQAITPATQIVYGAPDPSHTITASPPPLSPGKSYTWIVLNNYGNHMAYSSPKIKLPPAEFTIEGEGLAKPEPVYPIDVTLNSNDNKKVVFRWKNLDSKANTYQLYIYVSSDIQNVNAQLIVFQKEIVADGRGGTNEEDSIEIDASSILTNNKYGWRIIAVDEKGGGIASDVVNFKYQSLSGKISILTKERIIVGAGENIDTVINPIGLVELKVEVLDGSLEAPLLFYTDLNGYLERDRPVGAYRITAVKSGFQSQSKTVTVKNGEITKEIFYLERPPATIYGKVIDNDGYGIKSALIVAVSDRGDTAKGETDASGNFILNCYEDNWIITASKSGYIQSLPQKVSILLNQNYNIGNIILKRNPLSLSGKVVNSKGEGILGVNITLTQNGSIVGEIPSTPQSGEFSFMVGGGTYNIIATKTGFTTYMSTIEIASSKSITITMEPGAATISGYVYGKSWVNGIEVIAPITKAEIKFVEEGKSDTIIVTPDYTYGDFKVSLPGDKKYLMFSTADGFMKELTPVVIYTKSRENQKVYDTLLAFGYIKGIVKKADDGSSIDKADIRLVEINTFNIAATAKSSADGTFEISKIPDGRYIVFAGKDGLVLDSIYGNDTIEFSNGKSDRERLEIFLKSGDKTIKWHIKNKDSGVALVKIISPIIRNLKEGDSLSGAGSGYYIVSVDASNESLIDISYHRFYVADENTLYIDTLYLGLSHNCKDSIEPLSGKISLTVTGNIKMDSAAIFYKDFTASTYKRLIKNISDTAYTFEFEPPSDGRYMLYYFKLWRGSDIYGHEKEIFKTFIKPNMNVITKLEIIPSKDVGLFFPSNYNALFQIKAYVSSMFIPVSNINESGIKWELKNSQGCELKNNSGVAVTVVTGKTKTSSPVELVATIDTNKIMLSSNVNKSISAKFSVSGTEVKKIIVKRVDANSPAPITTSPSDYAEFVAKGYDSYGIEFDITPEWTLSPTTAGTISREGIFKPAVNFSGDVRIIASVNNIRGEYIVDEGKTIGLRVRYVIVNRQDYDTATNMKECAVVFPPKVVGNNEYGLLEIVTIPLSNQIKRGIGTLRTVDTMAFEIKQLENISFNFSVDSIRIVFSVPSHLKERIAAGKQKISVGYWLEDSLKWIALPNSVISKDGSKVSVGVTHFSKYTLVYEPSNTLSMEIAPNPFSPYIIPHYNPFDERERVSQYNGTCIKVQADIKEQRTPIQIRIYNITGDLVWSCEIQNADNSPYYIWWDGRTSSRDILPDGAEHVIVRKGEKMCRNGRYFVVLSAKIDGKEQKIMKPIVLMK